MSIREEQCNKVCRILDDVLANRTTERDSLIVAVRKAFESLEQFGNSEPLPSAQPTIEPRKKGKWISCENETGEGSNTYKCSACGEIQMIIDGTPKENGWAYCPHCGAKME